MEKQLNGDLTVHHLLEDVLNLVGISSYEGQHQEASIAKRIFCYVALTSNMWEYNSISLGREVSSSLGIGDATIRAHYIKASKNAKFYEPFLTYIDYDLLVKKYTYDVPLSERKKSYEIVLDKLSAMERSIKNAKHELYKAEQRLKTVEENYQLYKGVMTNGIKE